MLNEAAKSEVKQMGEKCLKELEEYLDSKRPNWRVMLAPCNYETLPVMERVRECTRIVDYFST